MNDQANDAGTAEKTSNWNVPNALTTLRILAVPFFAWALLADGGDNPTLRWVSFAIFALAMITDKIDGDLARKQTRIGGPSRPTTESIRSSWSPRRRSRARRCSPCRAPARR